MDCLYAPVKRDLISEKVAIYVMLGINKDGKKDVLGIWINENESATFWTEVFEEIKARGVEEILFISLDGLSGLSEAIEKIYPKVKTQRCKDAKMYCSHSEKHIWNIRQEEIKRNNRRFKENIHSK